MQEFKNALIKYIPNLRRYARALTGDFQLADQVVQQSIDCAVGVSHLVKNESEADNKVRLFSIFHLIYHDYINEQKNQPQLKNDGLANSGVTNIDAFENKYRDNKFFQVFNQLPVQQKQVFLLVTVERLLYEDVSKILDIPLGAMLSHLHTARKSIIEKVYATHSTQVAANKKQASAEKEEVAEMPH